ncbi:hypothetical protein CI088_01550 [Enterococcus plantarum]|uniref:Uncharacterized protein n=1 Tax=Enterococcus plantarum TaxID=1077675 RepID=A0A2W4A972_9ENTE|nr:hypothetical protein [Enterococcus plantarum]PZL77513.1 hypothetical protein CI088_01550 [Enterococcus plantarum]
MTLLDGLIIGGLSVGILFGILFLLCFISFIRIGRNIKKISRKQPKNKKKRLRWKRRISLLSKQKKRRFIQAILCFLLLVGGISGGAYSRYYQSNHLGEEDKEIISQTYFILDEVEQELNNIEKGADVEKTQVKLKEMLGILVSYASRIPSSSLNSANQQQLRNYYVKTRELGSNLYNQTSIQLKESDRLKNFMTDITALKTQQKEIFDSFNIKTKK